MFKFYNKLFLGFVFTLAGASLACQSVQAEEGAVSVPQDAVGVTEATFQELKNSHCYYSSEEGNDTVLVAEGLYCDSLVAQLRDKVIFRAEHFGEMYWINTADGLPMINRYLPDGFYQAGNKYYLISKGIKRRIHKNYARKDVNLLASNTVSGKSLSTPISEADWDSYLMDCFAIEEAWGDKEYEVPFSEVVHKCESSEIVGIWQKDAYQGQIIMRVENNGELYFIRPNYFWTNVYEIPSDNEALMNIVKDVAATVPVKTMKKVVGLSRL